MDRKLSVIVPAYRESHHINKNLISLEQSLKQLKRPYEIVVVCDGCKETMEEAKELASDVMKIYYYEHNMGKGYALKYGIDRASGDLVTFIDADMSIDPGQIAGFIKLMDENDADIVIGSKRHPLSKVKYPLFRRFQSFVYEAIVTVLFHIRVKDTQAGLKLFKTEVLAKVIPRVLVKQYAFDLELLAVARRLGYKKIIEAPIEVKEQFSTTTSLRAAWDTLQDTAAVFYRMYIMKYYDRDHVFIADPTFQPYVSVIIPVKRINDYVRETTRHLEVINYDNFEVIVLPDEADKTDVLSADVRVIATGPMGPAEKRDKGSEYASGEILAFLDDDAFPRNDWLVNAVRHFMRPEVGAVAGPGVTPDNDSIMKKASGAVYSSHLGSGSLIYRYIPRTIREVDDFPSVNLLVRKDLFKQIGGFDTTFWPGEDTKLCMDIVNARNKIIYDPDVFVWHHRRKLFGPHLQQVANYALHRGFFAKKYPKTSRRPTYFIPALFVLGLLGGPFAAVYGGPLFWIYLVVEGGYLIVLLFAALWAGIMNGSGRVGVLVMPGILSTHLIYGAFFIRGFMTSDLIR